MNNMADEEVSGLIQQIESSQRSERGGKPFDFDTQALNMDKSVVGE